MSQRTSPGAGQDDVQRQMKGCESCGRIWAPTRAPEACPECDAMPKAMDMAAIDLLIRQRQGRLREGVALHPFVPSLREP